MSEKLTINCPTDTEVWLEFGWIKGDNEDHDMLWYNEGRAEEFNFWWRNLMTKKITNEPAGRMYFKILIRPDCNFEIVCEDNA